MALRDNLKKRKQCFRPISIAEWDAGEPISVRALTPSEQEELASLDVDETLPEKEQEVGYKNRTYSVFAMCFGDVKGERVYGDFADTTLKEIADNIPMRVMTQIISESRDFTNETIKKN